MSDTEKIGGKSLEKFLEAWSRHPLSIFMITIVVTLTFVFMMFHNIIKDTEITTLTEYTYLFSLTMILLISILLFFKKQVLYNALDVLDNEITHRIHLLRESLENIEIGAIGEPYEEGLELLCPKAARNPISNQLRESVQIYEFLVHIQKDCGVTNKIDDEIKLKLSKFYYKENKFEKALEYADSIIGGFVKKLTSLTSLKETAESKCRAEAYFCKGLILKRLDREKESSEAFTKAVEAGHQLASCWICMNKVDSRDKDNIQEFIDKTKSCPRSELMKHCVNKLSTAYYKQSTLLSSDKLTYLRKALNRSEIAINNFDSWTAYYNKACDLSVMASFGLSPYEGRNYDSSIEKKLKNEALACLKAAFQRKPALVVHSRMDEDLKWLKENYVVEFYAIIGRVYEANYQIL